ncbi:hypothetical protein B0H11DRAFT_2257615 [Mycena galericulata]|nr:hypothetical protein B0H11DRAFT_2257615 [Mycena galericulata]
MSVPMVVVTSSSFPYQLRCTRAFVCSFSRPSSEGALSFLGSHERTSAWGRTNVKEPTLEGPVGFTVLHNGLEISTYPGIEFFLWCQVQELAPDKQDLQGLNIALDSKQELELVQAQDGRTRDWRGDAGATIEGRDSAVFSTPGVTSRPPSGFSDAGNDSGSASRMAALGKSTCLTGSAVKPPAASHQAPRVLGCLADHRARGPQQLFALSKGLKSPPGRRGRRQTKRQWKESDAGEVRVHSL